MESANQFVGSGFKVHYRYAGSRRNPPLVLLHAWSWDSVVFKDLAKKLTQDFFVIAPDLPGHGGSDKPAVCDLWFFAYTLKNFLDELGVTGKVSLAGHSLGGGVAIQFAAEFPERVHHVVLIDSTGEPATHRFPGWVWVAVSSDFLARFRNPWAITRANWSWLRNCFLRRRIRFMWECLKIPTSADLIDLLPPLVGKTTVIWAQHDRYYPSCVRLSQALGVDPIIIPKIGHEWVIMRPDESAELIRRAVKNAPQKTN